jgi:hypothetical protein
MLQRVCPQCGKSFEAQRSTAKFCSASCRVYSSKGKPPVVQMPTVVADVSGDGPVTAATRAELTAANVVGSMLGAATLQIARLLDSGESGGAAAQLASRLIELRREALKDARVAADPVDELRSRRDAKRHTG